MNTKFSFFDKSLPEERKEVSLKALCIGLVAMLLIIFIGNLYTTRTANAAGNSFLGMDPKDMVKDMVPFNNDNKTSTWTDKDPPVVILFDINSPVLRDIADSKNFEDSFRTAKEGLGRSSVMYRIAASMASVMCGEDITGGQLKGGFITLEATAEDLIEKTQTEILKDNNSILNKVFTTLSVVGVSIFFIMWMIYIMTSVLKERLTIDTFLRCVISLIVGYILLGNAKTLVLGFMQITSAINTSIVGGTSFGIASVYRPFFERQFDLMVYQSIHFVMGFKFLMIKGPKFLDTYMLFPSVLPQLAAIAIPFIYFLGCMISVLTVLVKNMVECMIRIYTAPIALAVAAGEGFGGGALSHWLKRTLSVALKPTLIVIVLACGSSVATIFNAVLGGQGFALFEIGPVLGLCMTFKVIKDLATNLQFDIA